MIKWNVVVSRENATVEFWRDNEFLFSVKGNVESIRSLIDILVSSEVRDRSEFGFSSGEVVCEHCGRKFESKTTYKIHLARDHKIDIILEELLDRRLVEFTFEELKKTVENLGYHRSTAYQWVNKALKSGKIEKTEDGYKIVQQTCS